MSYRTQTLILARRLAEKLTLYCTPPKQMPNTNLCRRLLQDVPYRMALEGMTAADMPYRRQA